RLPAASRTTTRRSYEPLASEVVSQVASYGEPVAVATSVYAPPPAGRTWKVTDATPEPESEASAARATAGPPTVAPDEGCVSEPAEELVESQVVRHGALVSVARVEPLTWISTDATREVASLAATEIGTSPLTVSPCVGAPIVPSGAVLSTIFAGSVVVVTLAGM